MNSIARLRFDVMRLAEALAERGELKRRIEQLGVRVVANARYQEGEEPAENAGELLEQLTDAVDRHALLIARINKTNTATPSETGPSPMRWPNGTLCRRGTVR